MFRQELTFHVPPILDRLDGFVGFLPNARALEQLLRPRAMGEVLPDALGKAPLHRVGVPFPVLRLASVGVEAYGKVRGKAVMLTREKVAMLRHDKNIRHKGDDGKIRNNPGKTNLSPIEKRTEAKRMLDRPLHHRSRNALRPI